MSKKVGTDSWSETRYDSGGSNSSDCFWNLLSKTNGFSKLRLVTLGSLKGWMHRICLGWHHLCCICQQRLWWLVQQHLPFKQSIPNPRVLDACKVELKPGPPAWQKLPSHSMCADSWCDLSVTGCPETMNHTIEPKTLLSGSQVLPMADSLSCPRGYYLDTCVRPELVADQNAAKYKYTKAGMGEC